MTTNPLEQIFDQPIHLAPRKPFLSDDRYYSPPPATPMVHLDLFDDARLFRSINALPTPGNPYGHLALATFLGPLGVDRFAAGRTKLGIFKLLTLGGLGTWWAIDVMLVLAGKYRMGAGRRLGHSMRFALLGTLGVGLSIILGYTAATTLPDMATQALSAALTKESPPEITRVLQAQLTSNTITNHSAVLSEGASLIGMATFSQPTKVILVGPDNLATTTEYQPGNHSLILGQALGAWDVEMECEHSCAMDLYISSEVTTP